MTASRRLLFFVLALVGALGLLVALFLLVTRSPRPLSAPAPTATPAQIVANVGERAITQQEWQRAVALDQAMSALVGQSPPGPEETLQRLINEHLVLREAEAHQIPPADEAQAQAWLADFLARSGLEPGALDQALAQAGLSRDALLTEIVPRLLRVERALQELPPRGNPDTWVAELRGQTQVEVLKDLSIPPRLPQATPRTTPVETAAPSGPYVGAPAPDFSLATLDGDTVRLSELRGRPVLLNFWASWCAPCRAELPLLQSVGRSPEAAPGDLAVLAVNVRESRAVVSAFVAELDLQLPVLLDREGQVSEAYRVFGLPVTLLVDRDGLIVARHVGPLDQQTLAGYTSTLRSVLPTSSPAP